MIQEMKNQKADGQTDFSGGLMLVSEPAANQYREGRNLVIRDGDARSRPGMKLAFPILGSDPLYFNEDNARYTDATHTGFWFPFTFVGRSWTNVQGAMFFQFTGDTKSRQIIVADGTVFVNDQGFVTEIDTSETIGSSEDIEFVQGNNEIVMFRSGDNNPLRWKGLDQPSGFVSFTSPGTTDRIPKGNRGAYAFGRLLVVKDDDVYVSDALDFDTYDWTYQKFGISNGDGDKLQALVPFRQDYVVAFKNRSFHLIKGLNSAVASGSELSAYVSVERVTNEEGLVGPRAWAIQGEQIYFLSYKGFSTVERTAQGTVLGREVALSAPVAPMLDRITWPKTADVAVAVFNNYAIVSVPMDSSTTNNKMMVYDIQLGKWVGTWNGQLTNAVQFFEDEEKLYFLGTDGLIRQMFISDPWDSVNIAVDTPFYDATVTYEVGWYVRDPNATTVTYKSLLRNTGVALTTASTWVAVSDTTHIYDVELELWTRFYRHGDESSPKFYGRGALFFDHENPKITVKRESEDAFTLETLYTDKTYSQKAYEVNNTAAWDNSNDDLDFATKGREDYTLFIPSGGLTMSATTGITVGLKEHHDLKFYNKETDSYAFALRITNTQGAFGLTSIVSNAKDQRFAMRKR